MCEEGKLRHRKSFKTLTTLICIFTLFDFRVVFGTQAKNFRRILHCTPSTIYRSTKNREKNRVDMDPFSPET